MRVNRMGAKLLVPTPVAWVEGVVWMRKRVVPVIPAHPDRIVRLIIRDGFAAQRPGSHIRYTLGRA
jgi:hypothetical protein